MRRMGSGEHTRWPPAHRPLLLACLLSVLVGCSAGFVMSTEAARHDSTRVLVAANRLERLVTDLETGQLGYVATGDDGSLSPWRTARADFPRQAAALQRLAAENGPEQGRRAQEIVRAATSYIREHAEPLISTARRDRAQARSVVTRAEGKRRIEAIRRQFDRFTEVQHRLAVAHERDALPATRRMIATAAGASGTLLLVFLLAGYVRRGRGSGETRHSMSASGLLTAPAGPGGEGRKREALQGLATLLVQDAPPTDVLTTAAGAMGRVLHAEHVMINRYEADGTTTVVGHWSAEGAPAVVPPLGGRWPVEDETVTDLVYRTGRPARLQADIPAVGPIGDWIHSNRIRRMTGCPIMAGDRLWGMAAVLSSDPGSWPVDTEQTMGEFAGLLGIAIVNARRRSELAASRVRLVEAADAARRRIERALHERTQQRLVAVGLELRAVEAMIPPGLDKLREQLSGASHDVTEIIDDLQDVARELHPAFLTRGGLRASLRALARRATVPVELDVRTERRLPQHIAVTVYYLVAEALRNAAAHAHASVVRVEVDLDDSVRLSVRDDGVGGAHPRPGSALSGLRDRIEALGGGFAIDSPLGAGTSLRVTLPSADTTPAGASPDLR
jgi:CHASE3 domain sensor protein/signal transduction histidine kinase